MTAQLLATGQRKALKPHQCFHCYRTIPAGQMYLYQTCKYDGVYTLAMHPDCDALWKHYAADADLDWSDFDGGYQPLHDEWCDSGEFETLCNAYRGQFPHAVCRMEFPEQKAALFLGEEVYG